MAELQTQVDYQLDPQTAEKSEPFIGRWNKLISTTNWEKGQIIVQWRNDLAGKKVDACEYSDEAWSLLVGGVSSQHVGRLRRTWERFGEVYQEYQGIYWSHFYAALDWDDAEMWLEGAIQNRWSVSQMRKQRWEVLGKIPGEEPSDADIVAVERAEESQSLDLAERKRLNDRDVLEGPVYEGPDFGDEPSQTGNPEQDRREQVELNDSAVTTVPKVRPFESFGDLPEDVKEAADAFKIAIIRHRTAEWDEISSESMLGLLDALKQLVSAE